MKASCTSPDSDYIDSVLVQWVQLWQPILIIDSYVRIMFLVIAALYVISCFGTV